MSRFVRASKYRHVYGTPNKRDQCYDNLKVSRSAWDTNLVKVNPLFLSVNMEAGGGGAFAVIPLANTGKLDPPLFLGHTSAVLDTDFHPFNPYLIASSSEDCTVRLWSIPTDGPKTNIDTPLLTLNSHLRKVGHVLFHPTASDVLASAGGDYVVKIWDLEKGECKTDLAGHGELIQGLTWSYDGALLATTCKDKKIRLFDVRSGQVVHEVQGHQGVKGTRVEWMGSVDKFVTTGFSRSSERQVFVWDFRSLGKEGAEPLKSENIDTASGLLVPKFDPDTSMLYLAGKGDGNIRYYEWVDDEKGLYILSEYKSSDPLRGIGFLPKTACNLGECEVARIFKVHPTMVEPISMKVPRKSDAFQSDIYPPTASHTPALTSSEFFAGKTATPILISLESGYVPPTSPPANAVQYPSTMSAQPSAVDLGSSLRSSKVNGDVAPKTEKEYIDAFHAARKEVEELKDKVVQREVRIRQLEAQLEGLMKEKH
ncbi:Coronin-like protein crn1 [Chytridiales sp. JEL 0842]|nr:Coronin-like protein crn1 [Chytridiales sp. JEL 0842]